MFKQIIYIFFLFSCQGFAQQASTKALVKNLLDQDLGVRKFSFSEVVYAASGKKVLPFKKENLAHQKILTVIEKAITETIKELNQENSPVRQLRRINEASRIFENLLLKKINNSPALTCTIPKNTKGKRQRSGYPDMLITHTAKNGTQTRAYLDPKLFEKKSRASSLRTFYYEPRTRTNKIQYDATHLLLGISHDGKQGAWRFTSWELCDLSSFQVRLKAEFQASNRDLYRKENIIRSSSSQK